MEEISPEIMQEMSQVSGVDPQAPPAEDTTAENIASRLDEETLNKIGARVVDDYSNDLESRSDWDKKRANFRKLLAGYRDPKNFPFENCSNVHIPLVGIACFQFQARAYEALLPPKEYAKCYATDGKSGEAASRAAKFLNYQLMDQMEEWEEDQDVLFLLLPVDGSAYKKTYYDPIKRRNVSRVIGPENFVTPYKCKRVEDAPHKTHSFNLSLNDLRKRNKNGVYVNADFQSGDGGQNGPSAVITEQSDKINGIQPGRSDLLEERLILEQHRGWDLNEDGIDENYIMTVDFSSRQVLRIQSRDYIDPLDNSEKVEEYFTGYTFLPNPESHYGFGFGHLLEGLNEAANTIINELIDAGSLSNAQSGFINIRSGIKTGDIKMAPGKLNPVTIAADDIRKAIYMLEFKEPSQALFSLLGLLQGYSKEIASITESMMGKLPPSDTTATTMLAVMEQGLKVFSTIHKRIHRSFKKELKKLFRLNSLYLDENVYFMVQDSTSHDMMGFQSGRVDFSNAIDVKPVSDPTITSRAERLIKAKQAYEIGLGNPLIQNNPQAMYELTRTFYEAIEEPNVDKIVQMPPPPPEPPDLSQVEENALFLQEKYTKPLEHQDHIGHLQILEAFSMSPWAEQIPPQGKKMLDMHKQEHLSMAYMQQEQAKAQYEQMQMQMMGAANGVQSGGMEGMVNPTSYARMLSNIGTQ